MKRNLNLLLLASVCTIVLTQFILNHWTELFNGGARIGDIVYNLSLGYIASYILYFIVVYIPEERSKKNLYPYISLQTNKISSWPIRLIEELKRKAGHEVVSEQITENDLNSMLSTANPYAEVSVYCPTPNGGVRPMNWMEFLQSIVSESKAAEDRILMHPTVVDTGVVSRIRAITGSVLFHQIEDLATLRVTNGDLKFLSNSVFHWMEMCSDLKSYTGQQMAEYLND